MSTDYLKNCPHGMGGTVTKCVICERDMAPSPSEMTAAEALEALERHADHRCQVTRSWNETQAMTQPCACSGCKIKRALPTLRAAVEERGAFKHHIVDLGLYAAKAVGERNAELAALRSELASVTAERDELRKPSFSAIMFKEAHDRAEAAVEERDALRSELARVREALGREEASGDLECAAKAALERWIIDHCSTEDKQSAWDYAERETVEERARCRSLRSLSPAAPQEKTT